MPTTRSGDGGGAASPPHYDCRAAMACSAVETLLVSSTGDVLVCRCRDDADILFGPPAPTPPDPAEGAGGGPAIEDSFAALRLQGNAASIDMTASNSGGLSCQKCEPQGCQPFVNEVRAGATEDCDDEVCWWGPGVWDPSKGRLLGGASGAAPNSDLEDMLTRNSGDDELLLEFDSSAELHQYGVRGSGVEEQRFPATSLGAADSFGHDDEVACMTAPPGPPAAPVTPTTPGGDSTASSDRGSCPDLEMLPSFDYSHFQEGHNDMISEVGTSIFPGLSVGQYPGATMKQRWRNKQGADSGAETLEAVVEEINEASPDGGKNKMTQDLEVPQLQPHGHANALEEQGAHVGERGMLFHRASSLPFRNRQFVPGTLLAVSQPQPQPPPPPAPAPPPMMHGVPSFLPPLSQICVRKVSAHPLGGHVLIISSDALLFSYGRNDHGQLGQGTRTPCEEPFENSPAIVTPLLENGGKVVDCAAGADHSLVVVRTEGRRIAAKLQQQQQKQQELRRRSRGFVAGRRSPSPLATCLSNDSAVSTGSAGEEQMAHHQMYGFGRNDHMKLGLVRPNKSEKGLGRLPTSVDSPKGADLEGEDVLLPRRVALHCKVLTGKNSARGGISPMRDVEKKSDIPPDGIFAVAASVSHSAALVHRPSGAIELFTWGKAEDGVLGIDPQSLKNQWEDSTSRRMSRGQGSRRRLGSEIPSLQTDCYVPIPTLVESLSYQPSHQPQSPQKSPRKTVRTSHLQPNDHPVSVALGPKCTAVITSRGKCLSFGFSEDGMLGLGPGVKKSVQPTEIRLPQDGVVDSPKVLSVSFGAQHVCALTRSGSAYSWGVADNGRLGIGEDLAARDSWASRVNGSKEENRPRVVWTPTLVSENHQKQFSVGSEGIKEEGSDNPHLPFSTETEASGLLPEKDSKMILGVCAGLDNTVIILKSGLVLSCGKRSGRLGQGEVAEDSFVPVLMFGGLRMWRDRTENSIEVG